MNLIAEAAGVRQLLAYLDHMGLSGSALGLCELEATLRGSSKPMALPAHIIVDLLEAAAALLGRTDLGVDYAQWLDPSHFGTLHLLGESCTTFAERIRLSQRFRHLSNNAWTFEPVTEEENIVVLCILHPSLRPRGRQYVEAVLGHSIRNARNLFSANWNPVRIEIAHAPPPSTEQQRRFFRCPIYYGSDRDAFVLTEVDWLRRLPRGNEKTVRFLEEYLSSQEGHWPLDLRSQVANLIAAKLAGGGATLPQIAALLAMSPRTLQRRLAQEGQSFGEILSLVREQVVRTHLSQPQPILLARLSHLLGYSEPSAASRFIRTQMRRSARALRSAPKGRGSIEIE